jgi:cytochrome P450
MGFDKVTGPIVRITPFEVHIEDSEYYDTLYSRSNKFDKYEWMSGLFGANNQTFTTAKSDLHAIRRAPLNPFFSKRSIARFEHVIREKVEIMCEGIEKFKEKGEVLVLSNAFSAYAGDVITEYCFGFSYDHLKSPGFSENFQQTYNAVSEVCHLFVQFPMMHPVSSSSAERT